jgi:hypothetical protein
LGILKNWDLFFVFSSVFDAGNMDACEGSNPQVVLEKLEKKMKDSLAYDIYTEIDDKTLPSTNKDLVNQLNGYMLNITAYKTAEVYLKCLMGRNLSCIQRSFKGKKAKADFMSFVKINLTSYCDSEIYFMMKLHKLSEEFSRIRFLTIGTGVLKSKLKQVEQILRKDSLFWTNISIQR